MQKDVSQMNCPATHTLTLLGKRHMLLILYTLSKGPKGFNDLQESLSINTATLAARLLELETEQIVTKVVCPNDSRCHYYGLTERGLALSTLVEQFSHI